MARTDYDAAKREFMKVVRRVVRPYAAAGWVVGSSGVRRQDESGHWAHFWFHALGSKTSLSLQPVAGTAAPYLLQVFNRQRIDRAPHQNFIAEHSQLGPMEAFIEFVPDTDLDTEPVDETPTWRTLSSTTLPMWLSNRFAALLPQLVALSSDRALLEWLADPTRSPSSGDLRYAALLAYHLRLDDDMESILKRAEETRTVEDADAVQRGLDLGYRSDRQRRYPQDWSHARFLEYLENCSRDQSS